MITEVGRKTVAVRIGEHTVAVHVLRGNFDQFLELVKRPRSGLDEIVHIFDAVIGHDVLVENEGIRILIGADEVVAGNKGQIAADGVLVVHIVVPPRLFKVNMIHAEHIVQRIVGNYGTAGRKRQEEAYVIVLGTCVDAVEEHGNIGRPAVAGSEGELAVEAFLDRGIAFVNGVVDDFAGQLVCIESGFIAEGIVVRKNPHGPAAEVGIGKIIGKAFRFGFLGDSFFRRCIRRNGSIRAVHRGFRSIAAGDQPRKHNEKRENQC